MDGFDMQKQRDAPRTKARILAAAQQAFSELGYAQVGIRDIAALAGVSSPMLLRYFGSKAGLFEAALTEAMRADDLLKASKAGFGAHLAGLLTDPRIELKPPAMIALASGDAEAREITARVSEAHAIAPMAKWLGPPDARARAVAIMSVAVGFVLCTRQIPLGGRIKGADKKLTKWLGETVQEIVDQN